MFPVWLRNDGIGRDDDMARRANVSGIPCRQPGSCIHGNFSGPSLPRREILCRGQRSVQLRSPTDDPAPVSYCDASPEWRVAFWQGPPVRGAQPET